MTRYIIYSKNPHKRTCVPGAQADFVLIYQAQVVQSWVKVTQVSMKFDFRSENFKRKFSSNLFACSLIIGCSKNISENFP